MEETRTALSEKIELLEKQVVETVQGATSAVTETVENVKEVVTETVDTVKDSVKETVDTVKETLDVPLQVERHPWAMFGGSVACGFLSGCLFNKGRSNQSWATAPSAREMAWDKEEQPRAQTHNGASHRFEAAQEKRTSEEPASTFSAAHSGHWLSWIEEQFGSEIAKLKGMAVGAVGSVCRDLLNQSSLPNPLKPKLAEFVDDMTAKLGGEPIQGSLLQSDQNCGKEASGRNPQAASQRSPMGVS